MGIILIIALVNTHISKHIMKTLLKSLVLFALIFSCTLVHAQKKGFEVPKNYAFKSPADYKKYDSTVMACSTWMCRLDVDKMTDERKKAEAFLTAWMEGNPNVKIELNPKITAFAETNPYLLPIFISAYAKYAITNPTEVNPVKGNLAGLKAVCKYYDNNPNLNKDKNLESLIKLNEKNKLRKWVTEQLKS